MMKESEEGRPQERLPNARLLGLQHRWSSPVKAQIQVVCDAFTHAIISTWLPISLQAMTSSQADLIAGPL